MNKIRLKYKVFNLEKNLFSHTEINLNNRLKEDKIRIFLIFLIWKLFFIKKFLMTIIQSDNWRSTKIRLKIL